ncbi:MAG: asparagine synthase (glutamine-hydrolyzing), partial [Candidatus Omnitrophica bacterium]|nr:asparagine synthase (glutamine-hydrolyzing) [Candidatus Omnitrophota bacterium]
LYYGRFGNVFLFASELKSILKHPSVEKEIDASAMLKYFAHDYIPNPHSIFKGISKLEPGSYAVLSGTSFTKKRYWNITFNKSGSNIKACEEKFRELLKAAVKRRLISDVPLGVFLSGGLDSSCVVAMMAELMPAKAIKTFTIGFKDKHFDESGDAEIIARHFGTDHRQQIVDAKGMLQVLPQILSTLDEPFADYSIIPTYVVSRFARKYVTVVLGGDGGDEFFAGYPSFIAHKISRIARFIPFSTAMLNMASKLPLPSSGYMDPAFKLRRYLRGIKYPEAIRHQVWIGSFPRERQKMLLSGDYGDLLKEENLYDESYAYTEEVKNLHYIDRVNYLYAKTYMTDDILTKVDRASMALGLEVRAPFLDPEFIDFATSLSPNLKLKGFNTKYIVKKAMAGKLPAKILKKAKHGFAAPVGQWFRKELKELLLDTFSKEKVKKDGIFNFREIDSIIQNHLSGRLDYSRELWSLFVFQMWHDKWFKGGDTQYAQDSATRFKETIPVN